MLSRIFGGPGRRVAQRRAAMSLVPSLFSAAPVLTQRKISHGLSSLTLHSCCTKPGALGHNRIASAYIAIYVAQRLLECSGVILPDPVTTATRIPLTELTEPHNTSEERNHQPLRPMGPWKASNRLCDRRVQRPACAD